MPILRVRSLSVKWFLLESQASVCGCSSHEEVQSKLLARTAPECRDFGVALEALLEQRRLEQRLTQPQKDWSRDELCDLAYGSYKALLRGVLRHPPRRGVVLDIADYLEATLLERNRLLIAAGYTPIAPYLEGVDWSQALKVAHEIMNTFELPAMILTRDWDVHGINPAMFGLFELQPAQVLGIPAPARNLLHLMFDPTSVSYKKFGNGNSDWERVARRDVFFFKRDNELCLRDDWLLERVKCLSVLPRFHEF